MSLQNTIQPPKENYIYNSTKIYKHNKPINIDVDSICEDLYKSASNREIFNKIMSGLEKDILSSETEKSKKQINQPNQNLKNIINGNRYMFKSTIPEGELIQQPPYQSRILHKKYTDVNANSKFYYPNEDNIQNINNTRSQWTNRANRIFMDSQNNFNNTTRVSNNNSMI